MLFYVLAIFPSQTWSFSPTANDIYDYDVNGYFSNNQGLDFGVRKFSYDGSLISHNPWGNYQLNSTDTTSLTGSFFALLDDFDVTKRPVLESPIGDL